MKKIIDVILSIVLAILIAVMAVGVGYVGYTIYKDVHEKLEEIHQVQLSLYQLIQKEKGVSVALYKILVSQTMQSIQRDLHIVSLVQEANKAPSYKYLTNVTVPIFQSMYEGAEKGWIGTGSIIKITDDYTYILTNKHVAPEECFGEIFVINGSTYIKAEVIKNSAFRDLSLIRIVGKVKDGQAVNGVAKAYPSDRVYSVGMYLGNAYIYTEGTFAGWQNSGEVALINAPSSYGCSGSGVFDRSGNLVAVIFATNVLGTFDTDSAKAVCVRIEDVELFLEGLL